MLLVSDDLVPRIGQWNSYMLGQIGRKLFEGFVLYQPWHGIFETKHLCQLTGFDGTAHSMFSIA